MDSYSNSVMLESPLASLTNPEYTIFFPFGAHVGQVKKPWGPEISIISVPSGLMVLTNPSKPTTAILFTDGSGGSGGRLDATPPRLPSTARMTRAETSITIPGLVRI